MRKIVLALLVLLLTVPAMAGIEVVKCAQVSDTNQVTVFYDVNDGNEIRAFGIKVHVDSGASISNLVVTDVNYPIFPGSIDINSIDGSVTYPGTPIGPNDANSFILEMGSLYVNAVNAPPDTNELCSFIVDIDCNVIINHDAARGGVVLKDTTKSFDGDLIGCRVTLGCFPVSDPCHASWVRVGEPECWCNPRQCYGDADGIKHSQKGMEFDFWVGSPDLTILALGWKKADNDPCFSQFICADFDHSLHNQKGIAWTFRVGSPDLSILATYWKGPNLGKPEPPTDCITP